MNKRLQKTCTELRVVTVEAQELVWRLAPRDWIGKRKAAIASVARLLGWDYSRTWNIAHGRARRIDADEMDRLRSELNHLEEDHAKRWGALNELESRLTYLRAAGSADSGGSGEGTATGGGRGAGAGAGRMRAR